MRPATHAIQGLYPILDGGLLKSEEMPEAARRCASIGVKQVQVRLKNLPDSVRVQTHDAVAEALEGTDALVVVNDRADLAKILLDREVGGVRVGLHLGQDDLCPRRARDLVGDGVHISWSTHHLAQVSSSADLPLNGIAFGPVFATQTKSNPDPVVGLERLAKVVSETQWPVTAIGGITPQRAAECRTAGAQSVAAIGALFGAGWRCELEDRLRVFMGSFQ